MILNFEEFLNEKKIGTVKKDFTITIDIESTKHSEERQLRHIEDGGSKIEEKDIIELMTLAIEDITKMIFNNILDIGDVIVLKDTLNDLNIACGIEGAYPKLVLRAITVMIHQNFKVGRDQVVLTY